MAVDRVPVRGDGERALRRIRGYSTFTVCATVVATAPGAGAAR